MASKIAVACTFRHHPDQDGSLIPASRTEESGLYAGRTIPFVGYMVAVGKGMRPFWSFVKYEALEHFSQPKQPRPANLATCRADWIVCPDCGAKGPFPSERKPRGEDDRGGGGSGFRPQRPSLSCPFCGGHRISRNAIKEGTDKFFECVGDLKDPLLQEAQAVLDDPSLASQDGSPFPRLLLGGPSDKVSPQDDVPPAVQGLAQARGRSFRLLSDVSFENLEEWGPLSDLDVAMIPEIKVASMDSEELRDGWSWNSGCLSLFVRLNVPVPVVHGPSMSIRY